MFRPMRRSAQALGVDACREVLSRGTSGVLALLGDGGWPYAVPMSYAFDGEKLYFHCAREGHKLDAIRREARASFCVVDRDEVVPAEYTTYFRSAIAFGTTYLTNGFQPQHAQHVLDAVPRAELTGVMVAQDVAVFYHNLYSIIQFELFHHIFQ